MAQLVTFHIATAGETDEGRLYGRQHLREIVPEGMALVRIGRENETMSNHSVPGRVASTSRPAGSVAAAVQVQ